MLQRALRSLAMATSTLGVLVLWSVGCSDRHTIGGLCPEACGPSASDAACSVADCRADAAAREPDAARDACAADGCETGAGPAVPAPCTLGPQPLTRQRLDLLMVVDDAASLLPWWSYLREGIDQFLHDAQSSGIAVGLQRFGESCEPAAFLAPLVPIATLPGNTDALMRAVPLSAGATTSTIPALDGAQQFARRWAEQHSDARVAVVLITDASPGACDGVSGDYDGAAARLARDALEATPVIKTHVVGIGALQVLPKLARAGGTEPALINLIPASGEVLGALQSVRDAERPCAFQWPAGARLVADSAVVVTEVSGNERRHPIERDRSICDREGGFYVDDEAARFPLIACPSTCTSLAAGMQASLSNACSAP